jgi:outer membrane protein assembly factor BamA
MKRYIAILLLQLLMAGCLYSFSQTGQVQLSYVPADKNHEFAFTIQPEQTDSPGLKKHMANIVFEMQSHGYVNASVDSFMLFDTTLIIHYCTGAMFSWGNINIEGLDEQEIRSSGVRLKRIKGSKIRAQEFSTITRKIIIELENTGYPFARIKLVPEETEGKQIDGILRVTKNKRFIIKDFHLKGYDNIYPEYIYRQVGIHPGDPYNEKQIQSIGGNIQNIPFLETIRAPEVEFQKSSADIFLYVKKKKANRFYGILGIAPSSEITGKALLTGEVSLLLINSIKRGETVRFDWKKLDQSSQNLYLGFSYPFVLKSPIGIDFSFILDKQDSSFLNTNAKSGLQYLLPGGNNIHVFYNILVSNKLLDNAENLNNSKANLFGIGIAFSKLDYLFNPRKGFLTDLEISTGAKKFTSDESAESTAQTIFKSYGELFIPVFKNATLLFRSQTALIKTDQLYLNELFRIGGLKTIRGFDEQSLNASFYQTISIEPRYLFEQNSNAFLFFDYAFVETNYTDFTGSNKLIGFGLGTSFQTKAGIFTVSYALGKEEQLPVQFRNAKIHFGFANRF